MRIFCDLKYLKTLVAKFVERLALITNQDMLIACGMQFEPARYTSPVRNHLSENVATYALRLTVTLHVLNCHMRVSREKNERYFIHEIHQAFVTDFFFRNP